MALAEPYEVQLDASSTPIASQLYVLAQGQSSSIYQPNSQTYFDEVIRPSFEDQILGGTQPTKGVVWEKNLQQEDSLLVDDSTAWLALPLKNPSGQRVQLLLEVFGIGIVNWYLVDEEGVVTSHRDDFGKVRSGRPVFDIAAAIPLDLNGDEIIQVYIGLDTLNGTRWQLKLWEPETFREDRLRTMMTDGLYFGLIFALILFCLLVFINIREPVYLFFALFLLSSAATVFFASGLYVLFLLEDYVRHGLKFLALATGSVDLFAALFSILLLRIHQTHAMLYRAWVGVIVINLLNTASFLIVTDAIFIRMEDLYVPVLTSVFAAALELVVYIWTLIAYWRTSVIAKYWFLVIFTHSVALIFWSVVSGSPQVYDIDPKRLIQAVTVFDAFMLCAILAYAYRVERTQRLEAQELSVENLRLASDIEQAKANFVSTVSHDLHGPVRAIGFFAETLRGNVEVAHATSVQRIEENVATVTALLESLVRFSEADAHRHLSMEPTELGHILYTLKNEFDPIARAKGLRLSIPDSQLSLVTDPVALSQVLRNLIENAIKYTEEGSVSVRFEEREAMISVSVVDTGRGIPSAQLAKVFDEFYQVSRHDSEGVGLGLSIVARLTKIMGIEMNVSSVVGQGSEFEILIPRHLKASPEVNPITQSIAGRINLLAYVYDETDDGLTAVAGFLDGWGVDLGSDTERLERADFLLVPGTSEGVRWVNQQANDKWTLVIGTVSGFQMPNRRIVVLPADVEAIKLRAVMQRILKSR